MKKLVVAFVAIIVIAVSAFSAQAQNNWIKVTPDDGSFTISMPSEPKYDVKSDTGKLGPYTTYLYSATMPDTIFIVGWADYAPTVKLSVQGEINANRDNFIKGVNGTLLTEKAISLGGHPGIEFTAEIGPDRSVISRVFVAANRPYQIIAVTKKGIDQTYVNKFLSSFVLNVKK